MRRSIVFGLAAAAIILLPAHHALAIDGWGPRFGITSDPDQFHLGAHLDAGYPADQLRFQPNAEVGLGDNTTLAAFNFDLLYLFSTSSDWHPYMGGGPGVNFVDHDRSDSETDAGLNFVGGVEHGLSSGNRFFTELRLGVIDQPDFKWTLGWTFPQ